MIVRSFKNQINYEVFFVSFSKISLMHKYYSRLSKFNCEILIESGVLVVPI